MPHPTEGNFSQLCSGDGFPHLSNAAFPMAAVLLLCNCWRALGGVGGWQSWQQPLPGLGFCGGLLGAEPWEGPSSHQGARAWQPLLLSLARFRELFDSAVTSESSLAGSRMPGQVCQASMGRASAAQPVLLVPRTGWLWEAELAEPLSKSAFPGSSLCAWRCSLQSQPALRCLLDEQGTGQDFRRALVLCGSTRLEGNEEYPLPVLYLDPL